MSAPSTRRLRDRDVASAPKTFAALKSAKTLTPVSSTGRNPSPTLRSSSSSKERLGSRVQRPPIKQVPGVDKAAASAVRSKGETNEAVARWSTSSVPRGRSQSPSDFIRVFRDSRILKGESDNRSASRGKKSGSRFIRDDKENTGFSAGLSQKRATWEGKNLRTEEAESDLASIRNVEGNGAHKLNPALKATEGMKLNKFGGEKSDSDSKLDRVRVSGHKSAGKVRVSENRKETSLMEDGTRNKVSDGYPSRLHEKLAFLEGKVKRIASDIKRTKEILDMNNPDASKVVLSDIQEKISGIEQAMVHVVGDSSKGDVKDKLKSKVVEKNENEGMEEAKVLVKGLNSEELEARLFPHQKLLRNRTSLKVRSGSSQIHDGNCSAVESSDKVNVDEKLLISAEVNPIELGFLDSLNRENKCGEGSRRTGIELQDVEGIEAPHSENSAKMYDGKDGDAFTLAADETLEEFDDVENKPTAGEEMDETNVQQLNVIGVKTSTGGWFVSEGESVLLAHDDGSCSFYDIANSEEKAVYKPPSGISPSIWRDCWMIRTPGADGCSTKYVVAASAGNSLDAGFCSWDFYTKSVRAFHIEDGATTTARTILGPLPNTSILRRTTLSSVLQPESRQWWCRPCGPLIVSAACSQRAVKIFDIRDGDQIMRWELQKPMMGMDHSSPVQWRNRGKIILAESESISVWDVNSLSPQSLSTIPLSGRKITALSVVNTDAELGGGVRQRVTSSEAEGNDGVFCTTDTINVMDLRNPSGIGLKIPKMGVDAQSVFTRGDSIYVGCTSARSGGKKQPCSQVQQFCLRKQRIVNSYSLPESEAHSYHSAITQVWGNSNYVMAVSGLGLFVFDTLRDDGQQQADYGSGQKVKEVIGPDDLYSPTFDYLSSRVLLISRDRPALYRHLV